MANDRVFWMVYGGFQTAPTHEHKIRQDAIEEATRLCKKHHSPFYVLETIAVVEIEDPPVKVTALDIPF